MRLVDFQQALGLAIREQHRQPGTPIEQMPAASFKELEHLLSSAGFSFTCTVQRSWCEGQIKLGARHTLARLPPEARDSLISEWIEQGGGRNPFGTEEAIAFLDFLSEHLQDDPQTLYWCRVEQAISRACMGRHALAFERRPFDIAMRIGRGSFASLVTSPDANWFVAPGIPGLVCLAVRDEYRLWMSLENARPVSAFPHADWATLEAMVSAGILAAVLRE